MKPPKNRSKSSKRWLQEHFDDPYVKQAQAQGYRSRAAFKLLEIQEKDRLIKPGMTVVDLGAAPGGWSQVAGRLVTSKGQVIALDLLPMDALEDVQFIQGDFREDEVLAQLVDTLAGTAVDVVISDMAPNTAGMNAIDQPRMMYLVELALDFALQQLRPGGCFLVKIFQGEGFQEYFKTLQQHFDKVVTRKPKASRPRSKELYLLAKSFKGSN